MILLLVLSCYGYGVYAVSLSEVAVLLSAGFCINSALVFANYGIANGIAGISFSVANSFPIWHAMFNLILLG